MKTRIITAIVGIALFSGITALAVIFNPMILIVVFTIVGAVGVYEALVPTKYVKSKFIVITSLIYSLVIPFFYGKYIPVSHEAILVVYAFILFAYGMFNHRTVEPREITYAIGMSISISFCFWSMSSIFACDDGHGLFYMVLVFVAAWACDTGAYFSGYFFGKHKLAAEISPKKTVEGAIGGIIFDTLCLWICCIVFGMMTEYRANTILVVSLSPVLAFAGILGDLIASYIKRAAGIKDYGKLMPGHGGILDRFDSVIMVVPLMFIMVTHMPVVLK